MRINQYIAAATGMSRRAADDVISAGGVSIDGKIAKPGDQATSANVVTIGGHIIRDTEQKLTLILNKPAGYVCSRDGQGSKTVYHLLPVNLHHLKPVGRLDKDSTGLLLMTNDGNLANLLTHPRYGKEKNYEVTLDKPLGRADKTHVQQGVIINDGVSKLKINKTLTDSKFLVSMREGRNRQIRRTFAAVGYDVIELHRTSFGPYQLETIAPGKYRVIVVK